MLTTIDVKSIFNAARMLQLSSDLPFLCTIAHEAEQKFSNEAIQATCQDKVIGHMKKGCILDQYYAQIIEDCPKLQDVDKILRKHQREGVLILSSFPETTLVVERVSPSFTQDLLLLIHCGLDLSLLQKHLCIFDVLRRMLTLLI